MKICFKVFKGCSKIVQISWLSFRYASMQEESLAPGKAGSQRTSRMVDTKLDGIKVDLLHDCVGYAVHNGILNEITNSTGNNQVKKSNTEI